MLKRQHVITAILSTGLLLFASQAVAQNVCKAVAQNVRGEFCQCELINAHGDVDGDGADDFPNAVAVVTIDAEEADGGEIDLHVQITGAERNTLYTVWIDFKNRTTRRLADDYPDNEGALERGVAPAFASTEGVTAGMGLDANGVITDSLGNGNIDVELDYNPLQPRASPVVGFQLATQGNNRVGGYWLRKYRIDPTAGASLQITDPETGLPQLHRATAQGITIVQHPRDPDHPDLPVTHGHTPGVGGVDHFSAFKGDFPAHCLP